ncbi:hypothetical protein PybrP1_008211 [[Pythium] brassicae (nom. inval.)]|nr:hypothetical protein PybrP1_008211 [[Pythium] brassicae (nom. inval.)]
MDDDHDDPIVAEIPVHLADELRHNIFLAQFPLRPAYRPMPTAPRAARVKPANKLLQLDYDVDQRSEHFDRDAEDYLKQRVLRLQSSNVPALTNYAVGVVRQGQLHLTPVTAVLQMRPSLAHIDDAVDDDEEDDDDVDMAAAAASTGASAAHQELKDAADSAELKEVQFQFKKKQSERAISAIQSSYAFKKQQINAEQWCELHVMDKNSAAADEEFEHLFSERDEELTTAMSPGEYLKALRYRTQADESAAAAPLSVLQILSTDHIAHFDALARLVPKLSEAEVLDALAHVAVSVRGRLLVKSSLACADAAAAAARDVILEELSTKAAGVRRMDLAEKHSLDPDATKTTLEGV